MKKQNTLLKTFLMFMVAALFTTGSLYAQNTTITDASGHAADASAVLDVYSTSLGMLLPRMGTAPLTPATGLLYFDNNTGSNVFKYYDGSNWKVMAITDDIYWTRAGGELTPKYVTDFVGIGTTHPGHGLQTWLTVRDIVGIYPQFQIITNVNNADASMQYSIWDGEKEYSHGIFNDPNNSATYNFKICNTGTLTGPGYTDPNTMMEIHDENNFPGIIDFNHQSRARAWLYDVPGQQIPTNTWQPIDFNSENYDEHAEFTPGSGSLPGAPPVAYFTATEEGYYQVNSRTEFFLGGEGEDNFWVLNDSYVSIAIYKGVGVIWTIYSQGNNLQIGQIYTGTYPPGPVETHPSFKNNNAPNVSDVVYLQAGEKIAIYAWQNAGIVLHLISGVAKTYVSIHKVS